MSVHVRDAPRLTARRAEEVAREAYGLPATAEPLTSDRDQNFLLVAGDGSRYVLKIANPAESEAFLDAQDAAAARIGERAPGVSVPVTVPTPSGGRIVPLPAPDGRRYLVRLVTYVPGTILANVTPHRPELLRNLGRAVAAMDVALLDWSHPAMHRSLEWDLAETRATVARHLDRVAEPDRRRLVEAHVRRIEASVGPALGSLRRSVIHNDANPHNVVVGVDAGGAHVVRGIIDFGDALHTCTVFEVAVAAAYVMLDKADPLDAAAGVVAGYHEVLALTDQELALLFDLICARLCVSVCIGAEQKAMDPSNAYLTVTEAPAWAMLDTLAGTDPARAAAVFREAVR